MKKRLPKRFTVDGIRYLRETNKVGNKTYHRIVQTSGRDRGSPQTSWMFTNEIKRYLPKMSRKKKEEGEEVDGDEVDSEGSQETQERLAA